MFPKNGVLIILCNLFFTSDLFKNCTTQCYIFIFQCSIKPFYKYQITFTASMQCSIQTMQFEVIFFQINQTYCQAFFPFFRKKKTLLQCLINRLIESNSMQSNYWHSQFHSIYFQRLRWDLKRDKNIFENAIQEKYGQCGFHLQSQFLFMKSWNLEGI